MTQLVSASTPTHRPSTLRAPRPEHARRLQVVPDAMDSNISISIIVGAYVISMRYHY